jgi:hypothetical protein
MRPPVRLKSDITKSKTIDLQREFRKFRATWHHAVVGVLVEVPVMLSVVHIVRRSRGWYERA